MDDIRGVLVGLARRGAVQALLEVGAGRGARARKLYLEVFSATLLAIAKDPMKIPLVVEHEWAVDLVHAHGRSQDRPFDIVLAAVF